MPYKWQTRHFVLLKGKLAYFKDTKEGRPKLKEWDLSTPNTLAFVPKKDRELELHCGDKLVALRADTAEIAQAWVECIHAHIKTASNMPPPSVAAIQPSSSVTSALLQRYPTAANKIQQGIEDRATKDGDSLINELTGGVNRYPSNDAPQESKEPTRNTRSSRPPPPKSVPPTPPERGPALAQSDTQDAREVTREAMEDFYEDHSSNQQNYEANLNGIEELLQSHTTLEVLAQCKALYGCEPVASPKEHQQWHALSKPAPQQKKLFGVKTSTDDPRANEWGIRLLDTEGKEHEKISVCASSKGVVAMKICTASRVIGSLKLPGTTSQQQFPLAW
jgi:hypothetical protein